MQNKTMEYIARECGISKMTVSRVLRGGNGVSSATRERVLLAAKRHNYELNALAQNFARRRSGFIGVATPFEGLIGSNYFAEIFKGFQRVLHDSDWDFALFDTLSPLFSDAEKLGKLYRTRRVDGLLVVAPHANDAYLHTLAESKIPLVIVGETVASLNVSSVACNDSQGIELLCSHLYSLGHRRIAFVGGPQDLTSARRRERAFIEFCRGKGLEVPPEFVHVGDYTMKSGREAGLFLLRAEPRPTAIIAANDMMAFGLLESAHELKIEVPREVSITGFDDLPTAADRFPSLTTVHQPIAEMAERSAQLLVDALNNEQLPKSQMTFPVSIVKRNSTREPLGSPGAK